MKFPFWRAAVVAAALAACSGQVFAHGHYYGGYYRSGWWIGGAALLGAGVALALSSGPRYGYSGVTYSSPPMYYPPPVYYSSVPYGGSSITYATPTPSIRYAAPRIASSSLSVVAYPAKGQSESQQMQDRQACENWAMNQSGLDPANITEYTTSASAQSYTRAMGACFKGRGYSIN
ncbi:hypothetical protein [Bordetella tumulicola]|uniref:hypothetical protein n=1 Tax=Bordetella tumulicola TaxID=1649133 RepID=UPI0039EF4939